MTIQILVMAPGMRPATPNPQTVAHESAVKDASKHAVKDAGKHASKHAADPFAAKPVASSAAPFTESGHVWRNDLINCLRDSDMAVRTIDTVNALARAIATQVPDVILLSDELGRDRVQSSSVEMLTLLRQAAPPVPVIMLGTRADAMERIICLECGADDYVEMPCNPRELLSRIRNILRYRPQPTRSLIDLDGCCAFGDFVFNRSRLQLTKHGITVALQESAMSLLGKLAEHPMKVLSRQALIELLHGVTDSVSFPRGGVSCERSLDVVVCRLRRVIETNPSQPKFLQTVRGFGYVFNPSGAAGAVSSSMPTLAAPNPVQMHRESIRKTVRRAVASADTALAMNPWFSEISFPARYPASEDLVSRSPA